jgi:hypothetical protein
MAPSQSYGSESRTVHLKTKDGGSSSAKEDRLFLKCLENKPHRMKPVHFWRVQIWEPHAQFARPIHQAPFQTTEKNCESMAQRNRAGGIAQSIAASSIWIEGQTSWVFFLSRDSPAGFFERARSHPDRICSDRD